MEQYDTTGLTSVRHMAGIVPIAAPPLEFNMPWHDSLMPISPNYLAAERAVFECMMAGCKTIWIVCHLGMQPLLRKRIGDYIWAEDRKIMSDNSVKKRRYASIFYVAIHPRDRDKRDSLGWSALYGADRSYRICSFLSKWVAPDKFYCAFPYGITSEEFIRKNYLKILKSKKKCVFRYNGKTVKDGLHTSFTFDAADFKTCRDYVKTYPMKNWADEFKIHTNPTVINKLRNLSLDEVYHDYSLDDAEIIDLPWFYDISTWEGYRQFMAAGVKIQSQRDNFFTDKERKNDPGRGRRIDPTESEEDEEGERIINGNNGGT